jgi:GNAT superfamily N-acetyltransferase
MEQRREGFLISDDRQKLDIPMIHSFLTNSYWAKNIPLNIVEKSTRNSLCFGVYDGNRQIGFARIVSDYSTFAYLCDVFILEEHRGKGLSKWMMECIMQHPDLQGLRRWILATRDAHDLYRKFGFTELQKPDRYMEIVRVPPYAP